MCGQLFLAFFQLDSYHRDFSIEWKQLMCDFTFLQNGSSNSLAAMPEAQFCNLRSDLAKNSYLVLQRDSW